MIRRSTLVVVLILAGLVALAFYLQRTNSEEEALATPTAGSEFLFSFASQIEGMRLEHSGSGIVEIERDPEGRWVMTTPPAADTDVAAVEAAISQLQSLPVVSSLEQGPGLDAAGLSTPTYRVVIRLSDGSQELMSVGKETPTGGGYYVLVSNRGMYIVNKFSLDPFLRLVDNPPFAATATPSNESGSP